MPPMIFLTARRVVSTSSEPNAMALVSPAMKKNDHAESQSLRSMVELSKFLIKLQPFK